MIAQKEHNLRVKKLMEKGERVFLQSEIGYVHQELLKWFEDKGVTLKHYSIMLNMQSAETKETSNNTWMYPPNVSMLTQYHYDCYSDIAYPVLF